ncbi:hypothetical protein FRC07_000138 [Ceratobasidium sp. 392]|nr:hypothetical protein FRC07_000138 [Ceratobasidium sp. 392]
MLYLQGNTHEANFETSTACHMAIACGLHKISSSDWRNPAMPPRSQFVREVDYCLEPPESAREHGERIAAFWQLVLVGHTAAARTGLPANFRDDGDQRSRVETVFPRPLEEYIKGKALLAPYATLGDVFTPRLGLKYPPDTATTLRVKSTALLERAVRLRTIWRNGVDVALADPDNVWECLYPHFVTLDAEIQLFYVLEDTDPLAYDRCLDSARAMESLTSRLTDPEIPQVGMMLGHCFISAYQTLERELKVRQTSSDEAGVDRVTREMGTLIHALNVLGKAHHIVAVESAQALKLES